MFRNSGENPSDNIASIFGLNGLNSLGLQDMYLDTSTLNSAETLSTASISPPAPMSVGSKIDFTALQEQQQQQLNATLLGNAMNGGTLSDMATILFQQQQAQQLRVLQQQKLQQQQHQLAQQQQLVQQQLALANAVNANHYHHQQHQQQQQQDEICHSLKMFAMLSAYSESQSGQHDIMQDFASNGYTSDNLYYNKNQLAPNQNQSFLAATAQSQQQLLQQLQAQNWVNQNFSDLRNNADNQWRNPTTTSSYMPSSLKMSATTITAGATMANGNDVSNNKLPEQNAPNKTVAASKSQKRHNALNKEKYASSKHCVFCENNNEPEAVIKSHSVRDSQGRVLCPKLRTYVCPICKASGDLAHTVKYCPKKPVITMEDAIKAESFRLAKSAYYKQQMKV